jgi:hypothetical protein
MGTADLLMGLLGEGWYNLLMCTGSAFWRKRSLWEALRSVPVHNL